MALSKAKPNYIKDNKFYDHTPLPVPKQLCALAHLESTHEAGIFKRNSQFCTELILDCLIFHKTPFMNYLDCHCRVPCLRRVVLNLRRGQLIRWPVDLFWRPIEREILLWQPAQHPQGLRAPSMLSKLLLGALSPEDSGSI